MYTLYADWRKNLSNAHRLSLAQIYENDWICSAFQCVRKRRQIIFFLVWLLIWIILIWKWKFKFGQKWIWIGMKIHIGLIFYKIFIFLKGLLPLLKFLERSKQHLYKCCNRIQFKKNYSSLRLLLLRFHFTLFVIRLKDILKWSSDQTLNDTTYKFDGDFEISFNSNEK